MAKQERSLDPQDWESTRRLGHRMVDDMIEYLRGVAQRPAWRRMPEEVKTRFDRPLPQHPQDPEAVYEDFLQDVLPYPVGNIHPRFWGWVIGTGTVLGAYAELLAGAMNTNTGGLDHHSANHVELQVIRWLKQIFRFPDSASGLLTSGCSAANLIGLAVARNAKAGKEVRSRGLQTGGPVLTRYGSTEAHSSIQKAVELLGLGGESLRLVPADEAYRIDLSALRKRVAQDREEGCRPFCVVGAAGTTNTGSCDDLVALADFCRDNDLWFHVDGAFGAWAALAPSGRGQVVGLERADSLALDLHKWMYMPYEIGCVLVSSEAAHREAFALTPAYLAHGEESGGMTDGDLPWFSDYGFQLSRGFRALKAWMSIKEHGIRRYGEAIEQNIAQARHLASLVERAPELELSAPVGLNVVCFRYVGGSAPEAPVRDEPALDALNQRILVELQERGLAVPSGTTPGGRYCLHLAITNHRSRREDFEVLVREVVRLGRELSV